MRGRAEYRKRFSFKKIGFAEQTLWTRNADILPICSISFFRFGKRTIRKEAGVNKRTGGNILFFPIWKTDDCLILHYER
jgi:hypothetical protein